MKAPKWISQSSAGRDVRVQVLSQEGERKEIPWPKEKACVFIGRHEECEIRLGNSDVSRFHACLGRDAGGRIFVADLKSRTGTYVDGVRISGRDAERRRRIRVGTSEIEIGQKLGIWLAIEKGETEQSKSRGAVHVSVDEGRERKVQQSRGAESMAAERSVSGSDTESRVVIHQPMRKQLSPVSRLSAKEQEDSTPGKRTREGQMPRLQAKLSLDDKKKLLWGRKREKTMDASIPWEQAEFHTHAERNKFQRLMGVKHDGEQCSEAPSASGRVLTGAAQDQVLQSVEKHFVAGMRRADGRTVGLGL